MLVDIDPDLYEVVFLNRCPFCGDKLKREWHDYYTLYKHNDAGRTWCKDTNFFYGFFRVTRMNPFFLNTGYDGSVHYE